MTAPASPPLLDDTGFDRTPALLPGEREALTFLGWQLRRCRNYDPGLPGWDAIGRLLAPLDAARLAIRDRPDNLLHRRSALDAAALVLSRCAEEGAAYWGWSEEDWVRLIGEDRHAFARPWPSWVDATVRPYVAAYGYLLCGFGAFHRLGAFNRLTLAERVFGRAAVGSALGAVFSTLENWGYQKAGTDAGYFARNVRTIEVLIDRGAALDGSAAAGVPWQHYDLGHGYCSYTFFEQCPHRMACARCDFYVPKPSSKAQLLEARADVDRRLALVPLTDGERAAVEQDQQALSKLLDGLANTPTPAGPTPREIAARPPHSSCQPYST